MLMQPAAAVPAAQSTSPMPYVHLLVVYLVWGSTYLAVKMALSGPSHATPLQLQAARLACAALLLAVFAWCRVGPPRGLSPRMALASAVSGILLWVLGNGLATLVAEDAPSSFIVMCMGLIPLWTVLIHCVASRTWPARRIACGLVLGFGGLVAMVAPALWAHAGQPILRPGREWFVLAMLLAGGLFWAVGTCVQKRQCGTVPVVWVATCQMGGAALVLVVLAGLEQAPPPAMPSLRQWLAFGFLVVFGSIVAMVSFQQVVRNLPPAVASTFAYVNPVVGMGLGAAVLGERVHAVSIAGFAVVLASLWLVLRRPVVPVR